MNKSFTERATEAGLCHPVGSPYRGLSAADLRQANPQLAEKAADFLRANKAEFTALITGKMMDQFTVQIVGSAAGSCEPVPIETLNDASAKYRAFLEENNFGSRESGTCWILHNGKRVAHVAFNGTVWAGRPQDWKSGQKPLLGQTFAEWQASQKGAQ